MREDLRYFYSGEYSSPNIATKTGSMERIIREATKIQLHPENMNREESFSLGKAWKLLLQTLKKRGKTLSLLWK
jgi:hypothetical protein